MNTEPSTPSRVGTASVVIFGTSKMSSLAWHLLAHDSPYTVAGFVEDQAFRGNRDSLHGLPLVDYERVSELFPPASNELLFPIGWRDGNRFRAERCAHARAMGYRLARYASSRSHYSPGFCHRGKRSDSRCGGDSALCGSRRRCPSPILRLNLASRSDRSPLLYITRRLHWRRSGDRRQVRPWFRVRHSQSSRDSRRLLCGSRRRRR